MNANAATVARIRSILSSNTTDALLRARLSCESTILAIPATSAAHMGAWEMWLALDAEIKDRASESRQYAA